MSLLYNLLKAQIMVSLFSNDIKIKMDFFLRRNSIARLIGYSIVQT